MIVRPSCLRVGLWLLALLLPLAVAGQTPRAAGKVRVVIQTGLGDIEVELDGQRAPVTTENFLKYVDGGFYEGGRFHRTVRLKPDNQPNNTSKIEVIQAGINPAKPQQAFPPIPLERTNVTGLKHLDGTISMARAEPDSATSDFFICLGAQPELDFGGKRNPDGQGFGSFGRVIKGLEVVKQIQQAPAEAQQLAPPVKIIAIKRIK